eukprot:scaffold5383_cov57-Phaeocystis_antarctica.AAC.3
METEDDDLDEETILSRFGRGRRLGRERAAMQTAVGAGAQEALPTCTLGLGVAGGITPEAAGEGAAAVQQQVQQQQVHVQVREQKG